MSDGQTPDAAGDVLRAERLTRLRGMDDARVAKIARDRYALFIEAGAELEHRGYSVAADREGSLLITKTTVVQL